MAAAFGGGRPKKQARVFLLGPRVTCWRAWSGLRGGCGRLALGGEGRADCGVSHERRLTKLICAKPLNSGKFASKLLAPFGCDVSLSREGVDSATPQL